MHGIRLLRVLMALVMVSVLSFNILPIQGQEMPEVSQNLVDVLITFYQRPDSEALNQVHSLGGNIKKIYNIVPTIAASLPSAAIQALRNNPRVRLIEDDVVFHSCLLSQTLPWGIDRIDAELAHPTYKGTGVKVAILDTGIDLDHPDLDVAGDVTFIAGTQNGDDDHGHGTLVAGIIAALDNDIGVVGVAPEAALYSVKVLNSDGDSFVSAVLSGVEWSINNDMQVMNMSFGSIMNMPQTLIDALDIAYNSGMVIFAGAGNSGNPEGTGENVYSPARLDSVIAVGATNESDVRCPTSSTGSTLELMAPGNNIYSTAMGGGYGYMSTTSTASPHAAGVAALLIESGWSGMVGVRNRLRDSATDLGAEGWDPQYGYGLINAWAALNYEGTADETPPAITLVSPVDQASYLIDAEVAADYSALDELSGLASISGTVADGAYIDTGSVGQKTFTVTATDNADNTSIVEITYYVYDTVTFKSPSADSFLRGGSPNANEGNSTYLRVQSSGSNRALVSFDLSGLPTSSAISATLILTISEPASNWGTGRTIDAHRLLTQWVEGNGVSGAGVTWNCPIDPNISNSSPDGAAQWDGGNFASATAPGVTITNGLTGEISFDVTADVQAGAIYGWLIKKTFESQNGQVEFYSKESTSAAPKLIIEF